MRGVARYAEKAGGVDVGVLSKPPDKGEGGERGEGKGEGVGVLLAVRNLHWK